MSTLYKHTSVHIYVGIKAQYDEQEKLDFYAQVMGDGTDNIHFGIYFHHTYIHTCIHTCIHTNIHTYIPIFDHTGKWDNIDLDAPGAYGKASEQMTDYMFKKASEMVSSPITK